MSPFDLYFSQDSSSDSPSIGIEPPSDLNLFESLDDPDSTEVIIHQQTLQLPPFSELCGPVDNYFHHINRAIPIFNQLSFMRMLHAWYTPLSQHEQAEWAAVNVVLALSYRLYDGLKMEHKKVERCVRNIRGCLTELLLRTTDLLGLQVLLGLVVLYHGARDSRLANVLIGSAVRLAYSMRLHKPRPDHLITPEKALERNRVFWLTYTLDRVRCIP